MDDVSGRWGSCVDDALVTAFSLHVVASTYGLSDDWVCADVPVHLCYTIGASMLRFLCPVHCGCRDARSAQFLIGPSFGCPWACTTSTEYKEEADGVSCTTSSAEEMQGTPKWLTFLENMWNARSQLTTLNQSEMYEGFLTQGCPYMLRESVSSLCGESLSFSRWCPVECGCRAPVPAGAESPQPSLCPSQCEAWRTSYAVRMEVLPCTDGNITDFANPASFFTQHVDTLRHVFGNEDHITPLLLERGCGMFTDEYVEWCGHPYYMRAVCPVTCGCPASPEAYACPLHCGNVSAATGLQ